MKRLLALLLLLGLGTAAHAQQQPVNCSPGVQCNAVTGPSFTGTGDPAWKSFGKLNANDAQEYAALQYNVLFYGADPTGATDSTAAINNAITAATPGCGVVTYPKGTYLVSNSIPIVGCVSQVGYGAILNYTQSSGYCMATVATGAILNPTVAGITCNLNNAGAGGFRVGSSYRGTFRDLRLTGVSSSTNIGMLWDTNTTGTPLNPVGNLNTAFNYVANLLIDSAAVGYGMKFIGTSGSNEPTDNTIQAFTVGGGGSTGGAVAIAGVDANNWSDSNVFTGFTRINLQGTVSPANAVCLLMGDGPTGGTVYSFTFEHLACDTFGSPGTDNRAGVVANNSLVKFLTIESLEFGPGNPGNDILPANITALQSYVVNQAPRGSTTFNSYHFGGNNVGIGNQANVAAGLLVGNVGQATGASQYDIFLQTPCVGPSAVTACYGLDVTPSAASNASAYTVTTSYGVRVEPAATGTNASITNAVSFYDAGQTIGGTTNIGFQSALNSTSTGAKAFLGSGTAASSMAGPWTFAPSTASVVPVTVTAPASANALVINQVTGASGVVVLGAAAVPAQAIFRGNGNSGANGFAVNQDASGNANLQQLAAAPLNISAGTVVAVKSPLVSGGTTFTVASGTATCATTSTLHGGVQAGDLTCTTAGTAASTVTLTLATASTAYTCWGRDVTTPTTVTQTGAKSATSVTLTLTSVTANDVVQFGCLGY